jgi:hypothetical protein
VTRLQLIYFPCCLVTIDLSFGMKPKDFCRSIAQFLHLRGMITLWFWQRLIGDRDWH